MALWQIAIVAGHLSIETLSRTRRVIFLKLILCDNPGMWPSILLVFALVLAVAATFGVSHPRVNFGWLALAFYFGFLLVSRA